MSKNKGKNNNTTNQTQNNSTNKPQAQNANAPKKEVPKNVFEARRIARKVLERKLEEVQVNAINEIVAAAGHPRIEITEADYTKRGSALKKVRAEAKKINSSAVNRNIKLYEKEMTEGTLKVMQELKDGSTSAFSKWAKEINEKYLKMFSNVLINSADLYAGASFVLGRLMESERWIKALAVIPAAIPGGTIIFKKIKESFDKFKGTNSDIQVQNKNIDKKQENEKQAKSKNVKVVTQTINAMLKEMGLPEIKGEFNGDVNKYLGAFKKTMANLPKHEEKMAYQALAIAFNEGGDITESLQPGLRNKISRFNKKVIKPVVKTARIGIAAATVGEAAGIIGVTAVAAAGVSIAPEVFRAVGKTIETVAPKTYTATKENLEKLAKFVKEKREEYKKNKQNKPPKPQKNQVMNLQLLGADLDGLELA